MNLWVEMDEDCPTTSSSRDILFQTLFTVWTRVLQNRSSGGMSIEIRVQSKEKQFFARNESTCRYHAVFRSILYKSSKSILLSRRMHHHAVPNNAKSSAKFPFVESCCISQIDICTCMCSASSRHYNTEETAEETMEPLLETNKRVILQYDAYQKLVVDRWEKSSNSPLLPTWRVCAVDNPCNPM